MAATTMTLKRPVPSRVATVEEVKLGLRRGLFVQVFEEGRNLLIAQKNSPINGPMAVAAAAMGNQADSELYLTAARLSMEPDLPAQEWACEALHALNAGDYEQASTKATTASRAGTGGTIAPFILAQAAYAKRDFDAVIRHASAALELEPAMAPAHLFKGLALYGQGKRIEAFASLNSAANADPRDLRPRETAAQILAEAGRFDAAATVYRGILEISPGSVAIRVRLMWVLFNSGNLEGARTEAGLLLKADPNSADATYVLALVQARSRQYPDAIKSLGQLAKLKPESAQSFYQAGLVNLAAGQPANALKDLDRVAAFPAAKAGALAAKGVISHLTGDTAAAERLLTEALAGANSGLAERIHFHLGLVALGKRDWIIARREFAASGDYIANFHPELIDWARHYGSAPKGEAASISAGCLLLAENLFEPARDFFKRTTSPHLSDVLAMYLEASVAARQLQFDEAFRLLEKVTALQPGYWPAIYAIGEIHLSRQERDQAISFYLRVVEIDPANEPAKRRLEEVAKAKAETGPKPSSSK